MTLRPKRHRLLTLLAAVPAGLIASGSWAQATGAPAHDDSTRWGLGARVGVSQKPYAGVDREVRALPFLMIENRYVRVAGLGVDLKLPELGPFAVSVAARYDGQGYKSGDADILAGMAERKGSVMLGGAVRWQQGSLRAFGELLKDVSGHSEGLQGRVGLANDFQFGRLVLSPGVSAQWLNRKSVGYYYGVRAEEALAARAAYEGKATTNLELNLDAMYLLAPQHTLMAGVGATRLGGGITDSPLVDRRTVGRAHLGYLYRF